MRTEIEDLEGGKKVTIWTNGSERVMSVWCDTIEIDAHNDIWCYVNHKVVAVVKKYE